MFQRSKHVSLEDRTVGVVSRNDALGGGFGYNLLSAGRETYLLDSDGRVVHEWVSDRVVFAAYLLEGGGGLLRDGSDVIMAPNFNTGGAAGFLEVVTWEGERVWSYAKRPHSQFLTHHDFQVLPNGNILILTWERKSREEAIQAGRRPEFIPDGEVWDNIVLELSPNGTGGADVVWQWSVWDHLVQEYDASKSNYGVVADHPELYDINFCVPGGKPGARDRNLIDPSISAGSKGTSPFGTPLTGAKDWLHINSVSYEAKRDLVALSFNVGSEIIIIDHGTTVQEAADHKGGKCGRGGDILYRWGNPQAYQAGSRMDQKLFCQHSVEFLNGARGEGDLLVFNNGRIPDRHWSSVDEIKLPPFLNSGGSNKGGFERGTNKGDGYSSYGPSAPIWSYGPRSGRLASFYCTHISAVQRLPSGNTQVTMGPQGTVFEVTPEGTEVFRYISPVSTNSGEGGASFLRQGETNLTGGKRSLFRVQRYTADHPALSGKQLVPSRYLEA